MVCTVNSAKVTVTESKNAAGVTSRVSRVTEGSIDYTYLGLTAAYDYTETLEGSTAVGQSGVVTRTIFNYEKQPIARIVDPGSASAQETAYFYDPLGRLSAVVDPLGTRTEYGYDGHGNLNLVVANSLATPPQITTYAYDDFGRLIRSDSPDAGITIYGYDLRGNLTAKTDARGVTTEYAYDDFDRLTLINYPTDADVRYFYDGDCSVGEACPADLEYAFGRLSGVAVVEPVVVRFSRYFSYTYDARGNVAQYRQNVLGYNFTTLYSYNAAGAVIGMTYPSRRTVQYLPQAGNPGKVGSVSAQVAIFNQTLASDITYDPFGDINGATYGNGLDLMVTRDLRGFPTNINVGSMAGTALDLNYTADAFGNITGITHLDPARNQTFQYDRLNQLAEAIGSYGKYNWAYDPLGNRIKEVFTLPGSTVVNTTSYNYDPGTNRLGGSTTIDPPLEAFFENDVLTLIYPKHHLPQGQPLEEQYYDLLDELIWLLDRADAGKKNVYIAPFLAHVRAFVNHAQMDQATLHRLLSNEGMPDDLIKIFDEYLWWDYRLTDLAAASPESRDEIRAWAEYAYLLQIVALEADPVLNHHDYSYDFAGTLTGQTVSAYLADPTHTDYVIGENMRMAQAVPQYGAPDHYLYDHLGRRVMRQGVDGTVIFIYDLAGNLIAEANANGTARRDWIYLGMHRLAVIEGPPGGGISCGGCAGIYTGAQNATAAVALFAAIFLTIGVVRKNRKFTALGCVFLVLGVTFLTMPTATSQVGGEQVYYYHNDHLGTPRVLTDSTGAVAWDVDYKPFGEIYHYYANSLPDTQPFRFPGQYDDGWTRFSYNWNRYYMPETGRYTQVDPLLFSTKAPYNIINSMNKQSQYGHHLSFSYANNNLLIYEDRAGKAAGAIIVIGAIIIVGTAAFVVIGTLVADQNCVRNNLVNCASKCKGDDVQCPIQCENEAKGKCTECTGTFAGAFGGDAITSAGGEIGGQIGKKLDED